MENRIVKFKSKESAGLNLHAIPGHFATSHSHINYYVDVTSIKTRVSEARLQSDTPVPGKSAGMKQTEVMIYTGLLTLAGIIIYSIVQS